MGSDDTDGATKAKMVVAYWLTYHNLPKSAADELSRMVLAMFPDSKIAKTYSSGRTKTTQIIKRALAPALDHHVTDLCWTAPFALPWCDQAGRLLGRDGSPSRRQWHGEVRYPREGDCNAGEILKKDNLYQCIRCGYDTYQPVLQPDNTTECVPCGTQNGVKLGTKQEGTANKADCLPYCAAGEELGASDKCEPCQQGFYKDNYNEVVRFDQCTACPVNLITATTGATSQDNCTRDIVVSTTLEYIFGRKLADIYRGSLKLLALTKGSVVAALEAQLYKKYSTGIEVVERVKDVLATVVKSGELPAPPGETYAPLKTVVTALPQVAVIPDGAPKVDSNSTVSALVAKAALWVTINPMTENTSATNVRLATQHFALGKAPPKKYPARTCALLILTTVFMEAAVHLTVYSMKPTCSCRDNYIGEQCETRKDLQLNELLNIFLPAGVSLLAALVVIVILYWVHKNRKRRLNDGEQRHRDKGTDGTQARHQNTSNRMANQQHANAGHSMPMTSSGAGTTSPRMVPSQATTSFSTGGVYETIPAQQGDIPSVYARMNQPTEATASNGAKFGGSSNNATATLRPSARHAPLPRYASLAAGPMANQLQDSSVEDLLFYRALHGLAPAYIVDTISPYTADSNLLTVPCHDMEQYGRRGFPVTAPRLGTTWSTGFLRDGTAPLERSADIYPCR
ncbi:hypothetical protein LSAT2_010763 [Lamellibrachia satsuma]|nr:hypothetical protein LSAT2_010763 [Lamellibrachia satsuma]